MTTEKEVDQNNNNPASICHQNRLKRFNRIDKKGMKQTKRKGQK